MRSRPVTMCVCACARTDLLGLPSFLRFKKQPSVCVFAPNKGLPPVRYNSLTS